MPPLHFGLYPRVSCYCLTQSQMNFPTPITGPGVSDILAAGFLCETTAVFLFSMNIPGTFLTNVLGITLCHLITLPVLLTVRESWSHMFA